MNELTPASSSGNGSSKTASERRVRHGLIEDWRDGLGILILLLVAAFSGALIARYWPDNEDSAASDLGARMASIEERLSRGKSTPEITALKDRVAKLETRLRNAELTFAAGAAASNAAAAGAAPFAQSTGPTLGTALSQLGTPAGTDATRKLVDDMAARLAALEGKTATAPADIQAAKDAIGTLTASMSELTTNIDAIGARLGRVENSDLLALASRASLATAVANLTRAAQGSSPFKTEYDAVAALMPNDQVLAAVESYARQGLPTTGTLIATFGNAADTAIDAERIARGGDWWTRLSANFMSLISSRPVGETPGTSTESRLARAELRLKTGDLRAAVKEITGIAGPARTSLSPWLKQAFARVKLESILADLNTRAVAALAGPNAADGTTPVPQLPTP